jgi:hypothetical protein
MSTLSNTVYLKSVLILSLLLLLYHPDYLPFFGYFHTIPIRHIPRPWRFKILRKMCTIREPFHQQFSPRYYYLSVLGTNISSNFLFPNTVKLEARLRKSSFSGKTIHSTYSEYVICNFICPACTAHAPCYNVTYGLSGFTIFSHIISQTARFS